MCLQDYQIARKLVPILHPAAGNDLSIPPNPKRVALRITNTGTGANPVVYAGVDNGGAPLAVLGGLSPLQTWVLIHMRDMGILVTGPFFVSGGGDPVGYVELIAPNESEDLFQHSGLRHP